MGRPAASGILRTCSKRVARGWKRWSGSLAIARAAIAASAFGTVASTLLAGGGSWFSTASRICASDSPRFGDVRRPVARIDDRGRSRPRARELGAAEPETPLRRITRRGTPTN